MLLDLDDPTVVRTRAPEWVLGPTEPYELTLEEVKSTATDAAATVKDDVASAAVDVKDQAADAAGTVQHAAQ